MQHDGRGLTQRPTQIYVTRLGDSTNDIALSGLVPRWCLAHPRANTF